MLLPTFTTEEEFWKKGLDVLGIDEVGRGAFAGPLVLGGVIFSKFCSFTDNTVLLQINDSKLLPPLRRQKIAKEIHKVASFSQVVTLPVSIINKYGVGKATYMGVRKLCIAAGKKDNCTMFMDGFGIPYVKGYAKEKQRAIIKGDRISLSIAAASIIAKVYRDSLMERMHEKYKMFDFKKNKGYGTKHHRDMLAKYGLTKIHRTSFRLSKFLP